MKMKTYKVLESHLYERLMCILKGEQNLPGTSTEQHALVPLPEVNANEKACIQAAPMEIEKPDVSLQEEEKVAPTDVRNYKLGDGIKRAPQENWLSFHQFTQKRQQRDIKKRKCRKKLGRR